MDSSAITGLIKDLGLPVVLVLFFAWQAWKREERMGGRITTLETFINDRLSVIVDKSVDVMARVVGVLDRIEARMDRQDRQDREPPS